MPSRSPSRRVHDDASWCSPRAEVVRVDGIDVHHVDTGPRGEEVVVLVPGIISTHRYFRHNIGPLSVSRRVLALDMPGFGRSEKPHAPYDIGWFADRLAAFLAAKGVARAHLVGNSMGGQIAMVLAERRPDLVARLVLVAPGGISTHALRGLKPLIRAAQAAHRAVGTGVGPLPAGVLAPVFRAIFGMAFAGQPALQKRYARGYVEAMREGDHHDHLRVFLQAAHGVLDAPMFDLAERLRLPTLIVWGRRDRILPAFSARQLARRMPHARLVIYGESGHCPMLDQPERFNRDVLAFLDEP